jgi:8-oxo-dGTP diphosphatase
MKDVIIREFGNRLRIRVSGILIQDERVLLVKHRHLGEDGLLWAPPGGGMDFGTSAEENLIREFMEETGIRVSVKEFLFVHEFLSPPLHSIELFFEVRQTGGVLITGKDPEMDDSAQIIGDSAFLNQQAINRIGKNQLHGIFHDLNNFREILKFRGYFKTG